jgi:c(7)-type cytochrome triheme protein
MPVKHDWKLCVLVAALFWFASHSYASQEGEKKAPGKLVFKAKTGNVTFDHAKHSEREKNDCKTCHPKLFPQSQGPLNFAKGMHKPAEAQKKSCAACHVAGGKAFESKGQCKKCHVK